MSLDRNLRALFSEIVQEAKANPQFAERLARALGLPADAPETPAWSNQRAPAVLDPFEEYGKGEAVLRDRLLALGIEQLRDVVAQYGMDRSRLVMKWKDTDRVIELIVTTVAARSRKGDAFRGSDERGPAARQ